MTVVLNTWLVLQGILALPQTIAPAGYGPSSTVLIGSWVLLLAEALLIAEVNVKVRTIPFIFHSQRPSIWQGLVITTPVLLRWHA